MDLGQLSPESRLYMEKHHSAVMPQKTQIAQTEQIAS